MKKFEWLILLAVIVIGSLAVSSGCQIYLAVIISGAPIFLPLATFVVTFLLTPYLAGVIKDEAWVYPMRHYARYTISWFCLLLGSAVLALGLMTFFLSFK
jgi:hypothetical protein